jgi:hypothetical protein
MSSGHVEPLYERIGRKPVSERTLRRAIAAYRADHPGMDELHHQQVARRLRRLDAGARQRADEQAEADAAGTTVSAWRQAKTEAREREQRSRQERDLAAARRAIGAEPDVIRRRAGRPGWTASTFHAAYREARDRAGGTSALDKEIAAAWPIGLKRLQELVRQYGRPV